MTSPLDALAWDASAAPDVRFNAEEDVEVAARPPRANVIMSAKEKNDSLTRLSKTLVIGSIGSSLFCIPAPLPVAAKRQPSCLVDWYIGTLTALHFSLYFNDKR